MVGRSASQTAVPDEEMVAKKFVGVRLPLEVLAALERLARADDRTVSYVINKILAEHLRNRKVIKGST
jgi:predicted transcriptional regulator